MKNRRTIAALGIIVAVTGILLSGCSGSASISVKSGNVSATGTVQFDHTCSTRPSCRSHGGVFMNFAQAVEHFFVNEAMADTAIFDASTGRLDISTTNVALTTSSGSGTLTLYNNGAAIASTTISFYRSGSSLYVANPSAVNSWVTGHQGQYDSFAFTVDGLKYSPTTTATTTASIKASMYYNGTLQAVGSKSYEINGTTTGCTSVTTCTQKP